MLGTYSIATGRQWLPPATVSRLTIDSVSSLATTGSSTDGSSFTTASFSAGTNRIILAAINSVRVGGPTTPTCSGLGLTWVQVETSTNTNRRLTLFRALGSPSSGSVTFDYGGETQTSAVWSVVELGNVNTTGTNGSGAIVQSLAQSGAGTTVTSTLAAFEHANNAHVCFVGLTANLAIANDADFAELGEASITADAARLSSQWAANQTDCTSTFSSASYMTISVEVKAG